MRSLIFLTQVATGYLDFKPLLLPVDLPLADAVLVFLEDAVLVFLELEVPDVPPALVADDLAAAADFAFVPPDAPAPERATGDFDDVAFEPPPDARAPERAIGDFDDAAFAAPPDLPAPLLDFELAEVDDFEVLAAAVGFAPPDFAVDPLDLVADDPPDFAVDPPDFFEVPPDFGLVPPDFDNAAADFADVPGLDALELPDFDDPADFEPPPDFAPELFDAVLDFTDDADVLAMLPPLPPDFFVPVLSFSTCCADDAPAAFTALPAAPATAPDAAAASMSPATLFAF